MCRWILLLLPVVATWETEYINALNAERKKHGLSALCLSSQLIDAAQSQSDCQAERKRLGNDGCSESTFTMGQRATLAGYQWTAIVEAVAAGQTTPVAVLDSWMTGQTRDDMLSSTYTHVGVAFAESNMKYWTQVMASEGAPCKESIELKSKDNGNCLDYDISNGNVVAYPCWGGLNQIWDFSGTEIKSKHDGKCLDFNIHNGNVQVYTCWGASFQQWYLGGFYGNQIKSKHDNQCLDLTPSGNVIMHPCGGGANQQWDINPTAGSNGGEEIAAVKVPAAKSIVPDMQQVQQESHAKKQEPEQLKQQQPEQPKQYTDMKGLW